MKKKLLFLTFFTLICQLYVLAQTVTISGKVTGQNKDPLVGVNVQMAIKESLLMVMVIMLSRLHPMQH
jgi:hypothetical protein